MAESPAKSEAVGRPTGRWAFLALMVVAFAAFNVLLAPLDRTDRGPSDPISMLLIGAVFAQPLLLSAWAAFGPPPTAARTLLSLVALSIVMLARPVIEWLLAMPQPLPRYPELQMLLSFGLALVPAWLIRAFTHWQLGVWTQSCSPSSKSSQFSLKYLLGLTTLVALLLAIVRGIGWMTDANAADVWRSVTSTPLVESALITLLLFPMVVISLVALLPRPSLRVIVVTLLGMAGSTLLALSIVVAMFGQGNPDLPGRVLLIQAGALLFCLVTAAVMRIAGYRLLDSRLAASSAAAPDSLH